jgi:protein kinase A
MIMNWQLLWEQVSYKNVNKIGSFGRVRLARNKKTGEYFAMKILKKADIIKLKQVDHVISENTILADIDHPFLVKFKE